MLIFDIHKELEIINLEKQIENKLTSYLDESQKEYILREKIRLIKEELGDIKDKEKETLNIKEKINKLKSPKKIKERLLEELNRYESMNANSPEMGIIKGYIDYMISLPWNIVTEDEKSLTIVKEKLDKTHYGLDKVKQRIIEYLAVKQNNSEMKSPIICLVGPPGVGKGTQASNIVKKYHLLKVLPQV